MAPNKAIYERKCRVPLRWELMDIIVQDGPDLIQNSFDSLKVMQNNMKVVQSRQKSYVDSCRKALQFAVSDEFFLKVYQPEACNDLV